MICYGEVARDLGTREQVPQERPDQDSRLKSKRVEEDQEGKEMRRHMKWSKNQANSPRLKDNRGGIKQKTESENLVANPGT